MNSYLGATAPIGTSAQQCEDAPIVSQMGWTGLGPLVVPAGYGVYYCALGAAVVIGAVFTRIDDITDVIKETWIFAHGNAAGPAPYSKSGEKKVREFKPDPLGDDCDPPPPSRTGALRHHIMVMRAQIAWRYTDLNPEYPAEYMTHKAHIKLMEGEERILVERYRNICGGDI